MRAEAAEDPGKFGSLEDIVDQEATAGLEDPIYFAYRLFAAFLIRDVVEGQARYHYVKVRVWVDQFASVAGVAVAMAPGKTRRWFLAAAAVLAVGAGAVTYQGAA